MTQGYKYKQVHFNNKCFLIVYNVQDSASLLSWYDASVACEDINMNQRWSIVKMDTKEEYEELVKELKKLDIFEYVGVSGLWTGLHKSEWQWNDGR